MPHPSQQDLAKALGDAASAHHEYEAQKLNGTRDDQWSGFYAAFTLGRLGGFAPPSTLSRWLEDAPAGDDWASSAAGHVLSHLK